MTFPYGISSSIEQLLRTNAPPSQPQIIEIQMIIKSLKKTSRDIDIAISRVHVPGPGGLFVCPKPPRYNHPNIVLQHRLFCRKERLLERMQSLATLLSAIRRLPAELVQIIFRHCLPTQLPLLHPRGAPLILCHVCSRWRQLALSTPDLWSAISFAVPDMPVTAVPKAARSAAISSIDSKTRKLGPSGVLASVHLWLQGSRSSPLTFSFTCTRSSPLASKSFSALMSQSHRWQSATIKMPAGGFVAELASPLVQMSSLQSLTLEFPDGDMIGWDLFVRISESAPHLRSLEIMCDGFHFYRNRSGLLHPLEPWHRLVRLDIFPTSSSPQYLVELDDTLDVLRCTPNLVTCALYMMYCRIMPFPFVPEVVLNNLVSLHVTTDQDLGYLLDRLVIPQIQDIQLDSTEDVFGWPQTEFTSLVANARCPITRFGVHSRTMRDSEFVECLQMMPELTCLELVIENGVGVVNDHVLDLLTPSSNDGDCLLRRLKLFTLYIDGGDVGSIAASYNKAFVKMISKRGHVQDDPLQQVQLRRDQGMESKSERCHSYRRETLRARLTTTVARFTPRKSRKNQNRLWKMMSEPGWCFDNVWEAYEVDV